MTIGPIAPGETAMPRRPSVAARFPAGAMLAAIVAITAARLLWLRVQPADLYPDEAQYWFWAKHLAFGYYSKPPLVAWLIALTTGPFGDGEFAVRLAAPLLTAGTAILVYAIGARLYNRQIGFWSAVAYASLPGASAAAFVIAPDVPLLLFWAAALYALIRAREDDNREDDDRGKGGRQTSRRGWWFAVGIAAGLGLLAKYAMAYWLLSALGLVLLVPAERRHLRSLLAAIGVALLIYLPNFWWNCENGFVSYRHTSDNADLAGTLFHPGAFLEFFGAQFALFGPLFFAGLLLATAAPRALAEPRARLLAAFSLPTLAMMLMVSLLSRAHANWAAPAYVSAIVLVVAMADRRGWHNWVVFAVALHLVATVAVFAGYQTLTGFGVALPARYDPLARLRGWHRLGDEVGAALARHPGYRLFADDRETLAALIYYVHPHPFDAVKWELMDRVKDEWDLTNNMTKYRGGNFLLVSTHNLIAEMRPSFAAIEPLETLAIPFGPDAERRYPLYLARDFKGYPQYAPK